MQELPKVKYVIRYILFVIRNTLCFIHYTLYIIHDVTQVNQVTRVTQVTQVNQVTAECIAQSIHLSTGLRPDLQY